MGALDFLVFSSLWASAITPALMVAASGALGLELPAAAAVLGFSGTLVVYGVDRLRDVERDRATTPARAAFVERNRATLTALSCLAAAASGVAAWQLPVPTWWVCAAALVPGLLHRRLKQLPVLKTLYVTSAWLAVCLGVPVAAAGAIPRAALPVAAVLGLAIAGNLVASNLRDSESGAARVPPAVALGFAMALCAMGALIALLGSDAAFSLWPVPLCQLAAIAGLLAAPRDPERYGMVVVDGSLGLGAAVALGLAG